MPGQADQYLHLSQVVLSESKQKGDVSWDVSRIYPLKRFDENAWGLSAIPFEPFWKAWVFGESIKSLCAIRPQISKLNDCDNQHPVKQLQEPAWQDDNSTVQNHEHDDQKFYRAKDKDCSSSPCRDSFFRGKLAFQGE